MAEALALPWRQAVDPHPVELGAALLKRLVRGFVHWRYDLAKVSEAESSLAERLMSAKSLEDVTVILDEPNPTVDVAKAELTKLGGSWVASLIRPARHVDAPAADVGPIADGRFRLGWAYLREVARLGEAIRAGNGDAVVSAPPDDASLLELIYDVKTPVEIAEALLGARRLFPALFALGFVMDHPGGIPTAIVNDLASVFVDSAHATLRLAAMDPRLEVDERVLPSRERFDLSAIAERHAAECQKYEGLPTVSALSEE